MKDKIILKLDEKALRKFNKDNWIAAPIIFFGACWTSYRFFTSESPEPESISATLLGVSILILVIWAAKLVWSQMRLYQHQLRNDVALYELTPTGITNHSGETQMWNGLKKIYFRGNAVFFSYMTFNRQAAFRMSGTGINAVKFYEACKFIKTHAPKSATEKFKLDKIPRG